MIEASMIDYRTSDRDLYDLLSMWASDLSISDCLSLRASIPFG